MFIRSTLAISQATLTSLLRNRLTNFMISLMVIFTGLCLLMSTVDAGIRFRLFENLMLSSQTILLFGVAWLYGFDILRREQQELLFILPLSTGIDRKAYLTGRFLGLAFLILLLGISLILLDSILLFTLEGTIELPLLWQILLATFGAILSAALVIGFGVKTSAFSAVIYALLFWFIGHGLDELLLFAQQRFTTTMQHFVEALYYLLPNFSLTDMNSEVLNRLPTDLSEWIFAIAYCVGYSILIMSLACFTFQKKALIGNE